jgi:asparagine synthase (glutamine-hydrolysing)
MLGSRRLAILDLSPAGHMPMKSYDGRFIIVYNGEVYNYKEIRESLKTKGFKFCSNTDTEVIISAYKEWGPGCLARFNGMFAIAIWDTKTKSLFLARDRLGIKPLYYTQVKNVLLFASEVKSLIRSGVYAAQISPEALLNYLQYQYVPWPNTMFEGVKKLPPGHFAIFENSRLDIRRYWQPPSSQETATPTVEELYELLDDAVKIRLISDVSVGSFLSGGIDSALITGLAAQHMPNITSYTVDYDSGGRRFDETSAARQVSGFLNIQNKIVTCSAKEAAQILPTLIWHLDEPVGDTLIYPFFALCRESRNAFKVALSGEGADEIFFGYRYYTLENIRRKYGSLMPHIIRKKLNNLLEKRDISSNPRLRALAYLLSSSPSNAFNAWSGAFFSRPHLRELVGSDLRGIPQTAARVMSDNLPPTPLVDSEALCPFYDMHFRMVDYILTVRDKMSMAVGLELRTPFLDYRVVNSSFSIPVHRKIHRGLTKKILRDVAQKRYPREFAQRKKIPFAAPIHVWLQTFSDEYLSDSELVRDGVLSFSGVSRWDIIDNNGWCPYPHKLWNIIIMEIWYRIFVTKSLMPDALPMPEAINVS